MSYTHSEYEMYTLFLFLVKMVTKIAQDHRKDTIHVTLK